MNKKLFSPPVLPVLLIKIQVQTLHPFIEESCFKLVIDLCVFVPINGINLSLSSHLSVSRFRKQHRKENTFLGTKVKSRKGLTALSS